MSSKTSEVRDALQPEAVTKALTTAYVGRKYLYYDKLDSTNRLAKELAAEDPLSCPEGTVILANEQDAGRGRLTRSFFSPPGKGLWFSLILRPAFPPAEAPKLTLMAAVAIVKAMKSLGFNPGIKWPNDIMDSLRPEKKLVGILTEMKTNPVGAELIYTVIGIGINVNIAPAEFPPEIAATATSLAIMGGRQVERPALFLKALEALEETYETAKQGDFAAVFREWRRYSLTIGREVKVIGASPKENFVGRALDIDEAGALIVATRQGERRVLAGDVSVRPAGGT